MTEAEWTGDECPKCKSSFIAKDKHGKYCCLNGCGWKEMWLEPGDDIQLFRWAPSWERWLSLVYTGKIRP